MADNTQYNPYNGDFQKGSDSPDETALNPDGNYRMRIGDPSTATTILNLFTNQLERVGTGGQADSYLVQQDGSSLFLLQDGVSAIILN